MYTHYSSTPLWANSRVSAKKKKKLRTISLGPCLRTCGKRTAKPLDLRKVVDKKDAQTQLQVAQTSKAKQLDLATSQITVSASRLCQRVCMHGRALTRTPPGLHTARRMARQLARVRTAACFPVPTLQFISSPQPRPPPDPEVGRLNL